MSHSLGVTTGTEAQARWKQQEKKMSSREIGSSLSTDNTVKRGRKLYRVLNQSEERENVALYQEGGWAMSRHNITEDAWIDDDAWVADSARAGGNTLVNGEASLTDHAVAEGYSVVSGRASMRDYGYIGDEASLMDDASISGSGRVTENASATGRTQVRGNARMAGQAWADIGVILDDDAVMDGQARALGNVAITHQAHLGGDVHLVGTHLLDKDAEVTSAHHYVVIPSMAPQMPSVTVIHTRSEPIFRVGGLTTNLSWDQVREVLESETFQGERKGPALTVLGLIRDLMDRWEDEDNEH